MKKAGKFFANILIIAYAIIAIVVTVLLLSYNDHHHSVIGGYTFILLTDDELESYGYSEGSLVLVKETKAKNINPGDHIFLYRDITSTQFEIKYAEVLMKDASKGEANVQYILEGNTIIDHVDVIGSAENVKVIPNLGTILSVLESRYGYLFLIVVVSFIAFLYEIYELIMEIKYGEKEDEDEYEYDEEVEDEDEYEEDEPKKEVGTRKKTATSKSSDAKKTMAPKSSTAKKNTAQKSSTTRKTTTQKSNTTRKTTTQKSNTTRKTATPKATTTKKTTVQKSK